MATVNHDLEGDEFAKRYAQETGKVVQKPAGGWVHGIQGMLKHLATPQKPPEVEAALKAAGVGDDPQQGQAPLAPTSPAAAIATKSFDELQSATHRRNMEIEAAKQAMAQRAAYSTSPQNPQAAAALTAEEQKQAKMDAWLKANQSH